VGRKLNILIVPDEGGEPRRLKVAVFWLKVALWGGILLLLAVLAGAFSYGIVARRALDYDRLHSENERLDLENQRIIRVAHEVEQSRQILAQIIRSLGGHLEMGKYPDTLLTESGGLTKSMTISDDSRTLLNGDDLVVERIMAYSLPTCMPADGFISQEFRRDYIFPERSHLGIDIAGKTGTPVRAAAAGRVTFAGWTTHFGQCMIIAHRNGYLTFYGHNQLNLKSVQAEVQRGETIALLGTSGTSSAPHLHFEIWKDGIAIDPMEFVQEAGVGTAEL
jgi:murein DD-endopeptidase MepM/ murein hydrolase activator NlpD